MPIMSEGEFGGCNFGPEGTRGYSCCMTNFKIDGQKLYDFNRKTGVLQISIPSGGLEILLGQIGKIPKKGRDITLPTPLPIGNPAIFRGVKKIESIPGLKDNEYLMRLEKT